MKYSVLLVLAGFFLALKLVAAEDAESPPYYSMTADRCTEMEVWDVGMGMCMPAPMAGMSMRMLMVRFNAFGAQIFEEGPRGRSAFAAPNMLMADLGTTLGEAHYLNLDLMGTLERWTFPSQGYPLLMQIGEENAQGQPFLDAQHPHSSPIMGLTLSDTIVLGSGKENNVKVFFAPRGEATDGPVAFMHRPTGMVNPDAPLGHHIGQDVGHITSTVLGASLKLGHTRLEISGFHGAEPQPTKVDLPIGAPDSIAVRAVEEFSPSVTAMASFAYVNQPEPDSPDIQSENRYSASVYLHRPLVKDWTLDTVTIFGLVTHYDHASSLASFAEEFLFYGGAPRFWGRMEVLQRTPAELAVAGVSDPDGGRWVAAFTLGYSHRLWKWEDLELMAGASVTKSVLPIELRGAYGGDPWSGKVFLQAGGMKMWDL